MSSELSEAIEALRLKVGELEQNQMAILQVIQHLLITLDQQSSTQATTTSNLTMALKAIDDITKIIQHH